MFVHRLDKTNYAWQIEVNLSDSACFPVCPLPALCLGLREMLSCTTMHTHQVVEQRRGARVPCCYPDCTVILLVKIQGALWSDWICTCGMHARSLAETSQQALARVFRGEISWIGMLLKELPDCFCFWTDVSSQFSNMFVWRSNFITLISTSEGQWAQGFKSLYHRKEAPRIVLPCRWVCQE